MTDNEIRLIDPMGDGDDLVASAIATAAPFDVGGYSYVPATDARGRVVWRVIVADTQEDAAGYPLSGDEVFNLIQRGRF